MTELADRQKNVTDAETVSIGDAVRAGQDTPAPAATP